MTSAEYTEAFDEVKRLGGDGKTTATERTEDQSVSTDALTGTRGWRCAPPPPSMPVACIEQ